MSGDSLAAGNEDETGITLETALSGLLNMPVIDNGISSQKSTQIAMRQGGIPIELTFAGNAITSGIDAVTAIQGAPVLGMASSQDPDYRFLSNTGSNVSQIVYGTICGVHGSLTVSTSGGPPSAAQTYNFTPDAVQPGGSLLAAAPYMCAANSVFTADLASAQRAQPAIFWVGRNNITQQAQIASDLANMIGYLRHGNYLCLTIPNAEYEPSGSGGYTSVAASNSMIVSTCGPSHTFDIRAYLISQYNPSNPVDVYDKANDIVPYTQRAIVARGTVNGALGTTGCPTANAPAMGSMGTGVMKVDSEYILISTISGNAATACTRGYGTGGVVATHSNGAAFTITDSLHISGGADALAATYIVANYKSVLLGTTPYQLPTGAAIASLINFPNTWTAPQTFQPTAFFGGGQVWMGNQCIYEATTGFSGSLAGNLNTVLCAINGSATIAFGGAFNTQTCFTMGGQPFCTAGQMSKGGWFSNRGYYDQGYVYNTTATDASTVVIADTADTLDLNAGMIGSLTVQLPTCNSTYDGKIVHIDTVGTITTLTLTAAAGFIGANANPGSLTRSMAVKCNGAQTTWFAY